MKRSHLCVFVIIAATSVAACNPGSAVGSDPAPADFILLNEAAQGHGGIRVAPVTTISRAEHVEAPAVIVLDERRTARIGALVDGVVIETFADVGDRTRAGQLLAAMHSPVVHEAWASYRRAIAERRHLEKELAFATSAHERARRLYTAKAISLQEVQRAEADRVAAEEALDMARTEVRRSEEELEHLGITNEEDPAGESGEQVPIKTPIAGVVLERLITPGTTVVPGAPLYVVSDLSALWALVEVDESLLSHFRAGQALQLRVAAYPGQQFDGTISLVGDMVNPKTRRVTIRCSVANADGRLKPQMFATAAIREDEPRSIIVVPEAALQKIDGQPVVFTADDAGRFRPRQVTTGKTADGLTEIRSGLRPGERIVIAGSFVLKAEWLRGDAGRQP
jgi:cobalt-zinc-cadmium efflux system membrane fusion protein